MTETAAEPRGAAGSDRPEHGIRGAAADLIGMVRLDPMRALYAAQVTFVSIASLFFAFLLNYQNTYWALLTVPLIVQPNSGLTIWRSVARLLSVAIGGVVALAMVAVFGQNGVAMVAVLALWLAVTGFLARFEIGLDSYAYAGAGLEALVVAYSTAGNGDLAFGLALARTTETVIPITVAFMISLVIFPQSVQPTLVAGMRQARDLVLGSVRDAVAGDESSFRASRQKAIAALDAIFGNLRATRLERSSIGPAIPKLQVATTEMMRLQAAAERAALMLADTGGSRPPRLERLRRDLLDAIDAASFEEANAVEIRGAARSFEDQVGAIDRDVPLDDLALDADPALRREAAGLASLRGVAQGLANVLRRNADVLDPSVLPAPVRRMAPRYPDYRAAIERGLRPALVFAILATIWIATASPAFQQLGTISGALTLIFPALAPRAILSKAGTLFPLGYAAAILPVLTLEMVLPMAESFPVFALLIGSYIFTLFYVANPPGGVVFGITGMILLGIGLQPSNTPTYNPLIVFNIVLAFCMLPITIGSGLAIFFPETEAWLRRHLRRASTTLLVRAARGRDDHPNRFLAQSLDILGDYGGSLDARNDVDRALIDRGAAIMPVGLELYDLRDLTRDPAFPLALTRHVERVAGAVADRTRSAGPAKPDLVLTEAIAAGLMAATEVEADPAWRAGIVRYLMAVTTVAVIMESGVLSPNGGDPNET